MPPASRSIVVIGDLVEGWPPRHGPPAGMEAARRRWQAEAADEPPLSGEALDEARAALAVTGGYLERLPLACIKAGLVDRAEIWHHWRADGAAPARRDGPLLRRRAFALDAEAAPFASADMLGYLTAFGPPRILLVLGLGVDGAILDACAPSVRIYNSIDAPALRVPREISARFDLILTGAPWQSAEVEALHPGTRTAVMPIGPEFASPETFHPLAVPKDYDLIYVAAAQPYKRHDILFDALAGLPRGIRALCVCGYGEMGEALRQRAAALGLNLDIIGPPGVSFAEVNALMNRARIGVVCGEADGAPAILTEYMLAGLPVLANERLCCGLQFITPATGMTASAAGFGQGILSLLERAGTLDPRREVLARWTWPHSVRRLAGLLPEK
ncbi:glycosyltransferase [Roseomonas sp. OT10]|uniref:glycosyltransferase n=1 Tax=Roseomonas cutis TaxID=2897332 RepID=UPI001E56CA8B|nr:glycosyltransferase [Roseomonas sp. OT10]UFN48733.1 glycosyltransferase [Roseomonas sp. OT10]